MILAVVGAATAAAACTDDDDPPPSLPRDTGPVAEDATIDAEVDTGTDPSDAGDTGVENDTGFEEDTGFTADTGGEMDAEVQDTGVPMNQVAYNHGVASGDPQTDRVIIWTRVTPTTDPNQTEVTVSWSMATDDAFTNVVADGAVTTSTTADLTVKIDVDGLSSGTTYFYRFSAGGVDSPIGRTKTLPSGAVSDLKFAVVSCSHFAAGFFNVYRLIANRNSGADDLDAVLHLGDYFYEYAPGEYADNNIPGRIPDPANETITLADYRGRHAQYKTDPDLQAMHQTHPMIAVWDDHESANNAWLGGAENHGPGEGAWDARRAAAVQAYYEWMPIREPAMGGDIFRQFQYGDLLTLTMLDTRLAGRSEQLDFGSLDPANPIPFVQSLLNPARSMLGTAQEQWLATSLAGPRATTWDLIGQQVMVGQLYVPQVPVAPGVDPLIDDFNAIGMLGDALVAQGVLPGLGIGFNLDSWDGYIPARQRLFQVLDGVANPVVVTGDFHNAWAVDLVPENVLEAGWTPTSTGAVGVEFITSSVTSPGFEDEVAPALLPGLIGVIQAKNPHIRFADLVRRGYVVVEFSPTEAFGQFFFTDRIDQQSTVEQVGPRYRIAAGTKGLIAQ